MDGLTRLRDDYAAAFLGYLTGRDEGGLRTAYELGRRAMADPLGLLHLVQVHHHVLIDAMRTAKTPDEVEDIGTAAAAFLADALATFQMAQRGFLERVSDPGLDQADGSAPRRSRR